MAGPCAACCGNPLDSQAVPPCSSIGSEIVVTHGITNECQTCWPFPLTSMRILGLKARRHGQPTASAICAVSVAGLDRGCMALTHLHLARIFELQPEEDFVPCELSQDGASRMECVLSLATALHMSGDARICMHEPTVFLVCACIAQLKWRACFCWVPSKRRYVSTCHAGG